MMKLLRIFQVYLSIFYGQLISIGLYENLLIGIPELIEETKSYFNISRVILGLFILLTSIFGLIVIWTKSFKLVFVSGILLVIIFLSYIIINTIHLTQNIEKINLSEKYRLITEIALKSTSLLFSIAVTFIMSSRGTYNLVQTNEN